MVTEEQLAFWKDNGFLVLPSFFTADDMDFVVGEVEREWAQSRRKPSALTVDLISSGARLKLDKAPLASKSAPYKLNDLYLTSESVRQIVLHPKLVGVLGGLMEASPLLCNSLNFEFGSEQEFHTDSLYMTPPRDLNLAAAWIALEDCAPDAGPLRYYPGSHKIPPFRFSDGRITCTPTEMTSYRAYMSAEVNKRNLQETRFAARKGDVFIWHAQLYHGGSPIEAKHKTRRSLVTHYFHAEDMPRRLGWKKVPHPSGGYWIRRPHQPTSPAETHGSFVYRQIKKVTLAARGLVGHVE